jgi:UDP-N-acetylmuramoylalanine--D-glutamate ligase
LCETLHCRVAVWLNLTPDHLDRHGDLAGYAAAKERIFRHQGAGDRAVVGVDDAPSRSVAERLQAMGREVTTVSLTGAADVMVVDGRLQDDAVEITDLRPLDSLRGRHNWQNVAVAYAAVRALGLTPQQAVAGLASFEGLPHRMEQVAQAGAILWVNDSKATNPDSAEKSLTSFANIFWIAGGKPKPGGFRSLRPALANVRAGYLIGSAADEIAADLGDLVPMHKVHTLEAAVREASAAARREATAEAAVLLAPACASFDQFANFEARGDRFRALAQAEAAA